MKKLNPGDRFPKMSADAVDGSRFVIPDELEGVRAVLLFYRGHW
jgi:peroxiredoxin